MPQLSNQQCKQRQDRFRSRLAEHKLDAAIISDYRDIYYFTGVLTLPPGRFPAMLLLTVESQEAILLAHADPNSPCVTQCPTYPGATNATLNFDNPLRLAQLAKKHLTGRTFARAGYQQQDITHALLSAVSEACNMQTLKPIDDDLAKQQQCKDPDEVEVIQAAIDADLAAYDAARKVIAPGATELEVLSAAQRAANLHAGEQVFHSGDYQCAKGGGPARDRKCEAGELYIIDAWTCYRGYWSDLCRTFIVGDKATDLQQSIFDHLADIQRKVPDMLKPGVRGTQISQQIDEMMREHPALKDRGLVHHAGHAVGLRAHMEPDLSVQREGVLAEGNVVSVEPGAYVEEARGGVRIENTYLITATGCRLLSDYPIELKP